MKSKSQTKVIAWLIIGLWLTRSIIFRLVNIDFASIEIARNFRYIWLILIPLAVAALVASSWNKNTSSTKKTIGILLSVFIPLWVIIILNFLSSFCEWRFSEPLYKHKYKNVKIRMRGLDCGAWDSDPTYQLVETRSIGGYLIKYSKIDKTDINQDEWIKQLQ